MEKEELKEKLKGKVAMPKDLEKEISEAFEHIQQQAKKIRKL